MEKNNKDYFSCFKKIYTVLIEFLFNIEIIFLLFESTNEKSDSNKYKFCRLRPSCVIVFLFVTLKKKNFVMCCSIFERFFTLDKHSQNSDIESTIYG